MHGEKLFSFVLAAASLLASLGSRSRALCFNGRGVEASLTNRVSETERSEFPCRFRLRLYERSCGPLAGGATPE